MSIRAILTPDDLEERKTEPGWYPSEIVKVEEAVTKGTTEKPSDGSMNAILYFSVTDPSKPEQKPRELKRYFNEKYMGMGRNLWYVSGLLKKPTKPSDPPQELTFEMIQSLVGKKMMVYVKKNAAGFDNVEDYRPLV